MIGVGPVWGGLLVASCVTGAFVVASRAMPWAKIRANRRDASSGGDHRCGRSWPPGLRLPGSRSGCLHADGLPLRSRPTDHTHVPTDWSCSTRTSPDPRTTSTPGGQVDFEISVTDSGSMGAGDLFLRVELPPGMRLVGPPAGHARAWVSRHRHPRMQPRIRQTQEERSIVRLGVQITQPVDQTLTAWASAVGIRGPTERRSRSRSAVERICATGC